MSRLADRLLADPFLRLLGEEINRENFDAPRHAKAIHESLQTAPRIVVDNVTAHYFVESDREYWLFERPDHFASFAPPFGEFWLETRPPAYIRSEILKGGGEPEPVPLTDNLGLVIREVSHDKRAGTLPWAEVDNSTAWGALIHAHDLDAGEHLLGARGDMIARAMGTRWVLECVTFREETVGTGARQRTERTGPIARIMIGVGGQGEYRTLPDVPEGKLYGNLYGIFRSDLANQAIMDREVAGLKPLLLALSFLACSNVGLREVEPSRAERRQHARTHPERPLLRYRVVEVAPHLTARRPGGGTLVAGSPEHHKALHICRGHFRTYTRERPLFGKYAGTFYVPAHVRGTATDGVSIHDYNVRTTP